MLFVLGAVLLVGLVRLEAFGRLVGRLAYPMAALAGVFWWFFLWPGFAGAVIAAVSLTLWAIQHWRRARAASEAATISVHARA